MAFYAIQVFGLFLYGVDRVCVSVLLLSADSYFIMDGYVKAVCLTHVVLFAFCALLSAIQIFLLNVVFIAKVKGVLFLDWGFPFDSEKGVCTTLSPRKLVIVPFTKLLNI